MLLKIVVISRSIPLIYTKKLSFAQTLFNTGGWMLSGTAKPHIYVYGGCLGGVICDTTRIIPTYLFLLQTEMKW